MTEPLTLTVVAASLLALARAVEEPTTWRYGIFAAWATAAAAVRLQALVLLPAFLIAVALDAIAARDRSRLRPLAWLAGVAVLVALAVAAVVVVRGGELSAETVLGAYTPLGESSGVDSDRVVAILWHAFDVAILGLAIPVLAIAALALHVFARRDNDPALRCVRRGHARLRHAARRPGRALRGRVRRARGRALPHHGAARCSRSGCAPGSRAEPRARSPSSSPSGRCSSPLRR